LPDIYNLLKGKNLDSILSSHTSFSLYFNVLSEVLSIMNSVDVFTEEESVEFYIIQAIIENKNPTSNEHKIITESIYSLYQNMTGLYGVYVYDPEILKTFMEEINLQHNMIQYEGGFRSFQSIIEDRCDIDLEQISNKRNTYVSLSQILQEEEKKLQQQHKKSFVSLKPSRMPFTPKSTPFIPPTPYSLSDNRVLGEAYGGKNNRISNPKNNTRYRKKYKKFVNKYIIKKKINKKQNKKQYNIKSMNNVNIKNKTRKNKKVSNSTSYSTYNYANKTLKKKKGKSKSSNHKSKYNKKTKTNYYNLYKHNKTIKH
jgi:hypothetical protein